MANKSDKRVASENAATLRLLKYGTATTQVTLRCWGEREGSKYFELVYTMLTYTFSSSYHYYRAFNCCYLCSFNHKERVRISLYMSSLHYRHSS